jgi:hypothetical protein
LQPGKHFASRLSRHPSPLKLLPVFLATRHLKMTLRVENYKKSAGCPANEGHQPQMACVSWKALSLLRLHIATLITQGGQSTTLVACPGTRNSRMKRIASIVAALASFGLFAVATSSPANAACGGWFQPPCPVRHTAPPPAKIRQGATPSIIQRNNAPAIVNRNGSNIVAVGAGNNNVVNTNRLITNDGAGMRH